MAARHYEGVLGLGEADEALCVGVIVIDCLLPVFGAVFLRHTVDRFEFERKAVDLKRENEIWKVYLRGRPA